MNFAHMILALSALPLITAQETSFMDGLNRFFRHAVYTMIGRTGNERSIRNARKLHEVVDSSEPFPCNVSGFRSTERPTSVHRLRPGDFDVIAAIGDSLTAANGAAATKYMHVAIENRGLSWAIGGQGTWREFLSLPNILKVFNPKLFGYSLGDSSTLHRDSQFNLGEAGAMSRDMPYMAKMLVKRIKADKRVNLEKDWKLVTFTIGANDFCADICYHPKPAKTAYLHKLNMRKTLDYLRDNLPRTLVNIVVPPNIEILLNFKKRTPYCDLMHVIECPCLFGKANERLIPKLISVMRRWQEIDEEVSLDKRYRESDEFAVVLQPFVADLTFPETVTPDGNGTDWSYLSADCFHFSQKGYARAANALWNNMLEPVGQKSTDWTDTFTKFLCPTEESPYIYTWQNSRTADTRQISKKKRG